MSDLVESLFSHIQEGKGAIDKGLLVLIAEVPKEDCEGIIYRLTPKVYLFICIYYI